MHYAIIMLVVFFPFYCQFLIPCGIQSWHRAVFRLHVKYFNIVLYRILSLKLRLSLLIGRRQNVWEFTLCCVYF